MKNLLGSKFLPILALVLGGGLAVAGEVTFEDPNVFNANANSSTAAPNWQPLDGETVNCGAANARQCKAYRNPTTGAISSIVYGNQQ